MTNYDDLRALADAFVAAEKAYNEKPSMEAAQAYVVAKRKFKSAVSPEVIIGLLSELDEAKQDCQDCFTELQYRAANSP